MTSRADITHRMSHAGGARAKPLTLIVLKHNCSPITLDFYNICSRNIHVSIKRAPDLPNHQVYLYLLSFNKENRFK